MRLENNGSLVTEEKSWSLHMSWFDTHKGLIKVPLTAYTSSYLRFYPRMVDDFTASLIYIFIIKGNYTKLFNV